ncbi:methionine ABC transporter ATP-binding protein [Arcanobacterium ihumii]|uniref:methionine ABC transporter ATP-binding protein n=1 Tax=Arcanobacterium ihumii TaxID=2138162 RepID=UPI000F53944E|nr:ATP-binding cassette domain-containing protein [Arcanobacterium ihumii]
MIDLQDVTKVYPRKGQDSVVALDHLSLSIPARSIHGIVGESGAGKSTLIRCLTALERPTSGIIEVDGQDLTTLPESALRKARRNIGMVFQGANLLDSLTAGANVAYPLKLAGVPTAERKQRVKELFELVGLSGRESSYPSQLSGGQRQRVGIARAIADAPAVLLADEPTSALDMETTDQILDLLKSVRDRTGVTVVVITHEMSVVRKICDSVTLLDSGKVLESASLSDAVSQPDSALSLKLVPLPTVDASSIGGQSIIDVFFTAHPGEPAGSKVIGLASQLGADIAAGLFETVGSTQVSRLALTMPHTKVPVALQAFADHNIYSKVRVA